MTAIVCRPGRAYAQYVWLFVVLGSIILLALPAVPRPMPHENAIFFGTYIAFCFVGAAVMGLWIAQARVIADLDGLRWRNSGKWRTARWEEVTDFFDKLPPPDKRIAKMATVIVTQNGTVKIGQDWGERESLRETVAQNAVNARVQEWGILGTRPEDDWPRVFRYDTLGNRAMPLWGVVILAFWAWLVGPKLVRTYGTAEWIWTAASATVLLLLLCAKASLPMLAWNHLRRRFGQRIVASMDKITFADGKRCIEAVWPDVTDYYVISRGIVSLHTVETRGGTFGFLAGISDSRLLTIIVQRYAQNVVVQEWRRRDKVESLGGVTAQWSSGREGVGERIYHYRTRTNRAMLWFIGTLAVMPLSIELQRALGMTVKADTGFVVTLSSMLVAGTLWAIWRYYAASIRTDADGITQYTPFGRRHFAWTEIAEYCGKSGDYLRFMLRNDKGQQIVFWSGIVGEGELKDEIERRAVNSRNQTWDSVSQSNSARTQQHGR